MAKTTIKLKSIKCNIQGDHDKDGEIDGHTGSGQRRNKG
jgi:hypothetical protein